MNICDNCANYMYDDENDCYYCDANLDEDDMRRFITANTDNCPFFNFYSEYDVVRKQN